MKRHAGRAYSILRQNGPVDLLRALRRFVVHGSLRDELLGALPATMRMLNLSHRCKRAIRPSRYTDADPFRILWTDPADIIYDLTNSSVPLQFGRVYGGDWDLTDARFEERPVYRSMEAHFVDGVPWEETEYYRRQRERLEAGKSVRGCTVVDDLPEYFARFDALYESLRDEGYKTQATLREKRPEETKAQNVDAPLPELNEIGVCISRDGSFLRGYRGEHRLAIAKLAGVDSVAVQVLVRHREWQSIRDAVREGTNPDAIAHANPELASHIDLKDLRE